jgi:serine protease Do
MSDDGQDVRINHGGTSTWLRHNRVVLMLVAVCCLSIGIAIGAIVRGIAGARSDDKFITVSHSSFTPDALSAAFARVAEQVEPSVVNIKVTEGDERSIFAREGTGSGVIVSPAGYIITNQHVIRRASKIKVKLANGSEYEAKVIGMDDETDLAVIKIEAREPLSVAKMGDSDKLNVGDWVLAIGSPFGLEQTVTAGIISAKDRITDTRSNPFQQFLQTDAAINPGNSGGPLVNLAGEVIGINTQIATANGVYNGIGFALPSSTAVEVYNQIVSFGRVRRGFLGINPLELTPQVARQNNITDKQGVLVRDVTSDDSPAARAGLQSGDIIVSINGQKVKNVRELIRRVASLPVGSLATIDYIRDGQQRTATVKLEERPRETNEDPFDLRQFPFDPRRPRSLPEKREDKEAPRPKPTLGLTVETLTGGQAKLRGMEGARGVLVKGVDPGSLAYENGIEVNDLIVEIKVLHQGNTVKQPVMTEQDFQRLTQDLKSGDDVVIKVLRKGAGGPRRLTSFIFSFTVP